MDTHLARQAGGRPFSPSAMRRFDTCPAQFWFEHHDDGSGTLPCDDLARRFGIAIHEGFRSWHRWLRASRRRLPGRDDAERRLVRECWNRVQSGCHDDPDAAGERFGRALPGLERLAGGSLAEMAHWASGRDGAPSVWTEIPLHNAPHRHIAVTGSCGLWTRADLLGIRREPDGQWRIIFRDIKTAKQAVDPRTDTALVTQAIWAANELAAATGSPLVHGQAVAPDREAVVLETANIFHADGDRFLRRTTAAVARINQRRPLFVEQDMAMRVVLARSDPPHAEARPSGLCFLHCPMLHRCRTGQAYVAEDQGADALAARLTEAIPSRRGD